MSVRAYELYNYYRDRSLVCFVTSDKHEAYMMACDFDPHWRGSCDLRPIEDNKMTPEEIAFTEVLEPPDLDRCQADVPGNGPDYASFALISHTEEVMAVKVANCNDCPFRYVNIYDDDDYENMCSIIPRKKTGHRSFESYVLKGDLAAVDMQCPLKRHSVTVMLVSDTCPATTSRTTG